VFFGRSSGVESRSLQLDKVVKTDESESALAKAQRFPRHQSGVDMPFEHLGGMRWPTLAASGFARESGQVRKSVAALQEGWKRFVFIGRLASVVPRGKPANTGKGRPPSAKK
jgi:hypothetical protein